MPRVHVSTTVDRDRMEACRRLVRAPDSQLIDRALAALLDALDAEGEMAALAATPYEDDPDLVWIAPDGPDLPYDAEIPTDVKRLAAKLRRQRATT